MKFAFLIAIGLLTGCSDNIKEVNSKIEERVKTKCPCYKIGSFEGINSYKVIDYIADFAKADDNANQVLNVKYTITASPLLITPENKTMYDKLTIKINVKYHDQERFTMLHYQYKGIDHWKYDDVLYYLIAQKIIQSMTSIEEFSGY